LPEPKAAQKAMTAQEIGCGQICQCTESSEI
jgi:hypothetical protein